jgi:hypothetical protein
MNKKIKDFNNKELLQKYSLKMDMVLMLYVTILALICNFFIIIFSDGGVYNRAVTSIIR